MNRAPDTLETLKHQLLDLLDAGPGRRGWTCGELVKKVPSNWRRDLAACYRTGKPLAGVEAVKRLVYELWAGGEVVIEPPKQTETAVRVWHPAHARREFPGVFQAPASSEDDTGRLRQAYNAFLPEHPSGAVHLFKLRRHLAWSRARFDTLIETLFNRRPPLVQLVEAGPSDGTRAQRSDSWARGETLYFSLLWKL